MKTLLLSIAITFITLTALAHHGIVPAYKTTNTLINAQTDTVKLLYDGKHVYYQKVINVDGISEAEIYLRAVQFMALYNMQQTYGNQQEGKLIFTTTQQLNNFDFPTDKSTQYTVQYAITLDMKNGRYRYTINSTIFYYNDNTLTFYDLYSAANNGLRNNANLLGKTMLASFEVYLNTFVNDLNENIINKAVTSNSNF